MKKLFLAFAAVAVTLFSCQKPATPADDSGKKDDTEQQGEVEDKITLLSDQLVNVGAESVIVTVKFTATADWTVTVDEDYASFLVPKDKSGKAGENIELKVTVQSLTEEDGPGRIGQLVIKAGKAEAEVGFMQGKVFIVSEDVTLGIDGGTAEFQVITNLEYTFKKYDGAEDAFPWAPVTFDKESGKGSMAVAKNGEYDARYAYVKFTIPAIQDPVYDDDGQPTGETQDHVVRFYVYQAGNAKEEWKSYLAEGFNVAEGANATVAMFNGKLLVSDGVKVYEVDPKTGAFTGTLATGDLPVQSIANDDEGNLLFANLGAYGALFDVYAVKASDKDLANPVRLIHFVNDAWSGSTGIDKVAARGNVFGNGVVSAMYGGVISYGGLSYTIYWAINGGKAAEEYYNEWNPVVNPTTSGWLTTPDLGDDLWCSNRAAFVPAGASASDGFFYGGYDGLYNVYYHNSTGWQIAIEGAGDWAGGPQGMHGITWNGKKILVVAQMGYVWWSEGWGMPGYLWVVDVTSPTSPAVLSKATYVSDSQQVISGDTENSSVDVLPVVDGNDLVVYFLDSSHGALTKVKFPKL